MNLAPKIDGWYKYIKKMHLANQCSGNQRQIASPAKSKSEKTAKTVQYVNHCVSSAFSGVSIASTELKFRKRRRKIHY